MENTSIIALSKQAALGRQMGIVANNIANINTIGFQGEKMMFIEHLVKSKGGESVFGEKLAFVRDIATVRDTSEGPIQRTENPLDLAIQGPGYFVVQTDDGNRYTRNGRFQLDSAGQMVNQQGLAVLSDNGQPFFFTSQDGRIDVSRDGTVTTANGSIGRLKVVTFENEQALKRTGSGLFSATETPTDAEEPLVVQGALEGSNVEGVIEMTRMIEVQRAYDGVRSLIKKEDERIRSMVRELGRPVTA